MFYVKIDSENTDRSCRDSLRDAFSNKCYICEDDTSTFGETEHRIPKAADKTNKLLDNSSNLFFACRRCNNIKSSEYYDKLSKCQYQNVHCGIIDCTKCDPNEYISIIFRLDWKDEVEIVKKKDAPCINNTVSLLRRVYCPEGKVDTAELGILKSHIIKELGELEIKLRQLHNDYVIAHDKPKRKIGKHKKEIVDYASPENPFFAIKLSYIEELYNENRNNGFGEILGDILKELSSHPAVNNCCDRKDSCSGVLTTLQSSEISNT